MLGFCKQEMVFILLSVTSIEWRIFVLRLFDFVTHSEVIKVLLVVDWTLAAVQSFKLQIAFFVYYIEVCLLIKVLTHTTIA